jgi:hypothetical protein
MMEERNDRAVSVTTGYMINLGIATTAVALFFFGAQGVYADIQENTAGTELLVANEKLVSELEKADRLADEGTGNVTMDMPSMESTYEVKITDNTVYANGTSVQTSVGHSADIDPSVVPVEFSYHSSVRIEYSGGEVVDIQ